MLAAYRKRIDREDEGFTLIELMVVVLIIAILLAIAIPTFLGARERAQDRAAQSDIRNTLAAEKVYYTDDESYTDAITGANSLKSIEPSLTYAKDAVATEDVVTVHVSSDGEAVCIAKKSEGGKFFSLIDVATGSGAGTYYDDVDCATAFTSAVAPTSTPSGYVTGGW